MSHQRRFEDSSSSSSSPKHKNFRKQRDEETPYNDPEPYSRTVGGPPRYNEEPRDKNMDSNFAKNPCLTWIKMLFPHFKIASLSVAFAVILIIVFLVELLFWNKNAWS
jgi:hypothetical protein